MNPVFSSGLKVSVTGLMLAISYTLQFCVVLCLSRNCSRAANLQICSGSSLVQVKQVWCLQAGEHGVSEKLQLAALSAGQRKGQLSKLLENPKLLMSHNNTLTLIYRTSHTQASAQCKQMQSQQAMSV